MNNNDFKGNRLKTFPHFFTRIKSQFPDANTGSFVDWEPIDKYIVSSATTRKVYPAQGADDYTIKDAKIAKDATNFLKNENPHAAMVYFGAVDETGHQDGFHPSVKAIERVDRHVGSLMSAVQSRLNYESENWLVVVSTDHGGQGTGHDGGQDIPEIYTSFLIVSGQAAAKGKMRQQTYVVDVPVTALVHLGVEIDPEWKLDGQSVGLR